ncbi:phosphatase, PAP2 family protein [Rickettsia massiliae str. AZT80]|uniref:Phosphatase, PAP2 family protein n=1 Tax=Rickettsia massiliae str. AZT80 TaxID=1105112 RepID=H6QIS3_RICMA|nr:phosphatase, PAP2 family protein [Rickettsia massiliae str. AZT80]
MLFKINPEWILNFRSEMLTNWFKIFSFFASDYFYITIIAIAYWLNPRKRLFLDLGWLISFATLLNVIIKKAFSIPRPPSLVYYICYLLMMEHLVSLVEMYKWLLFSL